MIGRLVCDDDRLVVTLEEGWVWRCEVDPALAATLNLGYPRGASSTSKGASGTAVLKKVAGLLGGARIEREIRPGVFEPAHFGDDGDECVSKAPKQFVPIVDCPGSKA